MAQVDKPILPPFLYRYRKIPNGDDLLLKQEIAAIKNEVLWCSAYKQMNDPMEGFYEPTGRFQKHTSYSRAVGDILDAKRSFGICCFSDTHDNELMWTHYASNYEGICVGYRPDALVSALPDDVHLVRVAYGAKPPDITANDGSVPRQAARKILSHKKSSWVYEREWRVLGEPGPVSIAGKRCVTELRLGSRINNPHRDALLQAAKGTKIRVYRMTINQYEHGWERLNPAK